MSAPVRMQPSRIQISAPGSFMVAGEHAVLRGYSAVVAAAQHRITVELRARADDAIIVESQLGSCHMRTNALETQKPFHFVGGAIRAAGVQNTAKGFDLSIEADMPPDVGLGSSAAVTVAVYAAVHAYLHGSVPANDVLWRACRDVVRAVQGNGSGADAAAAVYGGVLLYKQDEGVCAQLATKLPEASLYYVGYKTPTADVIRMVENNRLQSLDLFRELDRRMEGATQLAAAAIRADDIIALEHALRNAQDVLQQYGVCDTKLNELIGLLLRQEGILAAKISGSGLGDCVLTLGHVEDPAVIPFRQIPVTVDPVGFVAELK